jgi:hypothetical protein
VQEAHGACSGQPPVTLAGPHICSQLGSKIVGIAKGALTDACAAHGGVLNAAEIGRVLDALAATPQVFSLYSGHYGACGEVHRTQRFTQIDAPAFTRFILKAYCGDGVRAVFAGQFQRGGAEWGRHFVDGLAAHIEANRVSGFVAALYARYRALALREGLGLNRQLILDDPGVHGLLHAAFSALAAEIEKPEALTNAINERIGKAFKIAGPSPLKATSADIAKLLTWLNANEVRNPLRRAARKTAFAEPQGDGAERGASCALQPVS